MTTTKITFEKIDGAPQAEGVYLYSHGFFPLDKEFVFVYWQKPAYEGGDDTDGYWACHNGRDVRKFRGEWFREVNQAAQTVKKDAVAVNDDDRILSFNDYRSYGELP
jgi:hypothetical protein